MVRSSGRLIAVGEVVIAFTRMQLRGFNDDATRLIAFIFARDTYVMKKTMGRGRTGAKWTACGVAIAIFSCPVRSFIATTFFAIKMPVVVLVIVIVAVEGPQKHTEFPINWGTEDPRYKVGVRNRMNAFYKTKWIYIIEFISTKFTTQ